MKHKKLILVLIVAAIFVAAGQYDAQINKEEAAYYDEMAYDTDTTLIYE